MNISTDFRDVTPDRSLPFGGYEWWYFDGLSKDGTYGYVIIFYRNNPFSTKYIKDLDKAQDQHKLYPAVSVSVYKKGKPIYYSFLEFERDVFNWDENEKKLTVDSNSVCYQLKNERLEFALDLDQELDSGFTLKGSIRGEGNRPNPQLIQMQKKKSYHAWNLLMPASEIKANFKIKGRGGEEEIAFEGFGYLDHNKGEEPMKDSFKDWYWGRFHFENFSLVYYLMQKHNEQQFEGWLVDRRNQTILEYFREADLDYFTGNMFGLRSARKIELKSGQVSVNIQCNVKIDDGPFYQRFISDSIVKYDSQVYAAHGFSEYIYPNNIYNRFFWPLVHMRLRYKSESPHWVQKSGLMYPWTW